MPLALQLDITCADCADDKEGPTADMPDEPHLHTPRRVTPDEPGDASPAKVREGWRGPPPADEGPKAHQQQQQHHHHQREPSPPPPPAPPRETPPFGVLRSAATGATYALLKVLVHEKTEVTVMLGAPVRYEGQWPERRAVLERRRVVIKRVQLYGSQAQPALTELMALRKLAAASAGDLNSGAAHIVPLVDAIQDDTSMYIITRYADGGDLFEKVRELEGGLPRPLARRYFAQVLRGLLFLKRHRIAHGDVSLENVLLASWGQPEGEPAAHLIDLGSCCLTGLSGMCPVADFTYRGKYSYASPEVLPESLLETPPNALLDPFAVDVWSLGILLYALQTGHPLYVGPEDGAFSMLCEGRASELLTHYENFGLVTDPVAKELICAMLRPVPSDRPTLEQIAQHSWVAGALPEPAPPLPAEPTVFEESAQ